MMKPIVLPPSAAVRFSRYDNDRKTLLIGYQGGGVYRYFNVPADVVREFELATSKGAFVNEKIKPAFNYERLGN